MRSVSKQGHLGAASLPFKGRVIIRLMQDGVFLVYVISVSY